MSRPKAVEGLVAAVARILNRHGKGGVHARDLIAVFDRHEHALEEERPHRNFRTVAGEALRRAMAELGLDCDEQDVECRRRRPRHSMRS